MGSPKKLANRFLTFLGALIDREDYGSITVRLTRCPSLALFLNSILVNFSCIDGK